MKSRCWKLRGEDVGGAAGCFTERIGRASRGGFPRESRDRFDWDCAALRRDADGGRRRHPCDFLDRKVYVGVVVVMASAALTGPTRTSLRELRRLYSVSRRSLSRWVRWWRQTFVLGRLYREACGWLLPPVDEQALPYSLLMRFQPDEPWEKLLSFMKFLAR